MIEVETASSPVEYWLETQDELLDALQSEAPELHTNRFHYIELLRSMLPDLETAKKMTV
jgi:hypothetical protein